MKTKKKAFLIELIISIFITLVSFVLAIIYKNQLIITIVSVMVCITSMQNIVSIFREKNSNYVFEQNINSIEKIVKHFKPYISVDELEIIERNFLKGKNSYLEPKIYIISNNLTNDKSQFSDEIIENINQGAIYVYITTYENKESIMELSEYIRQNIKDSTDFDNSFNIYIDDLLFLLSPEKYTIVIYDKNFSRLYPNNLRAFCCSQDNTTDGIYYFEMSYSNSCKIKSVVENYCKTHTTNLDK